MNVIKLKGKSLGAASGTGAKTLGTTTKKSSADYTSTSAGAAPNMSNLPITVDLDPLLYGIAEDSLASRTTFTRLYKDMYYYDAICGTAVDLYSSLPFSEFTLGGVNDVKILDIFYENIERLNIRTLLNELSIDYLVTGTFLGSLLYNRDKKLFFDIMPHDIGNADIIPMPFYSQDPIITMKFPEEVRKALGHPSKRIEAIKEKLGQTVIDKLLSGSIELDPIGTIYLPRKTFAASEGTSLFKRVLPIYLIEKNLFRGTLLESAKRQRGILHITVGDGDQWEPTQADMESITDLFLNADADPLGAIITTRLGITTEELRSPSDFWKFTDISDQTATMKLRAMGISDSLIGGDATINCVIGSTLIPTSNGLLRIGSLFDHTKSSTQPVNFLVSSRYGIEKATKWVYSGEQSVISVTAESGNNITGTPKHRLLVLRDSVLDWVYLKDVMLTDHLCLSTRATIQMEHCATYKNVKLDYRVTYIIGCILKKGYREKDVIKIQLNRETAERFIEYYAQIFEPITFVEARSKFFITITNVFAVTLLTKLVGSKNSLPWSITKNCYESQLSFIAALVDTTALNKIVFDSPSLGKELQCLLNSLGIMCNLKFNYITFPEGEDYVLYSHIDKYCATKHAIHYTRRLWFGFPMADGTILPYDECDKSSEVLVTKYRFVKVVLIKDAGVQKVYDLSINPNNPSYVANGLVSHNTTEASLSVFIEQMRAYRDRITRKLLYNKVFPLISMVNGISTKNGKVLRSDNAIDVENAMDILQDGSKLLIPVVHWNKQLKPEGDTAYLDLLDRMTANGVPVPLRAMAAAGGFNLDELLVQQDDDLGIRQRIKVYMDKLAKFKAASEEGGGDGEMEASTLKSKHSSLSLLDADPSERHYSSVLGSGGKRSLLSRQFDPEITDVTKTGKKKIVIDQRAANRKANNNLVKAVKSISKNQKTPLSHSTITEKE